MSAVNSSSSINLYQLLQQVSGDQSQGTTADGSAVSGTSTATTDSTEVQGSGKHHHHHGGGGQLQNQIQSAVAQALQNSTSTTDPNTIIANAIEGVLKGNGSSATTPQASTATGQDPTGSTAMTADAQKTQFNQLLQSYGVDPKQFQADFKTALQNMQSSGNNGNSNDGTGTSSGFSFATLFSSFPRGSAIDTTG